MQLRILALALALGVALLPTAPRAAASPDPNALEGLEALIVVSESDLPALLASGYLSEHALLSPADIGLDQAALTRAGQFSPDALLTPRDLGLDNRFPFWGANPFFRGFHHCCGRPPVPLFFFGPPLPPVAPFPIFARVGVVVLPPPLALPLAPPVALPPPAPLAPRGPGAAPVPIIPEAETLALLGMGFVALAAAAWWRGRQDDER